MQWPILVPFGIEESSSLSESAATMPPWRFSKRAKKGERDDGGGELGHGLGTLGHGVLGKLTGEHQAHGGLDLTG
eukprot:2151202-Pyramimonas_sp.AAC.2